MNSLNESSVKTPDFVKKANNSVPVGDLRSYSLTPREILDVVERGLPVYLVRLKGLVVKDGNYVRLVETESGAKVDLVFDDERELVFNVLAEVEGLLSYSKYVQGGGFYAKVNVKKFSALEEGESFQKHLLDLEAKLKQKSYRGFSGYVQSCLSNNGSLRVAVLYGKGAQVHKDFEQAFMLNAGEYKGHVEFSFYETSLNDRDLAKVLEKVKDFSMVFVLRGGGAREELQRVGGYESARVVVERNVPLYLAVGHTLDKGFLLLERVADYVFATPSIAGAELGKVVAQVCESFSLREKQRQYSSEIATFKAILEKTEVGKLLEEVKHLREELFQKSRLIGELQRKANKSKWLAVVMIIINLLLLWILIF